VNGESLNLVPHTTGKFVAGVVGAIVIIIAEARP
jgi:hypothetical protein